jgi:hypothetical protein
VHTSSAFPVTAASFTGGFNAAFLENDLEGAEPGEGRLEEVQADKGREAEPTGVHPITQGHTRHHKHPRHDSHNLFCCHCSLPFLYFFMPAITSPRSTPYAVLIQGFEVMGHAPVEHPINR